MAKPRIYFDACCFIEVAKGNFGKPQTPEWRAEAERCKLFLQASRDGKIDILTSGFTIAEAVHIGENDKPTVEVKDFFARLLLSGRDVLTVMPDPFIMELARDLAWDHGIGGRVADRIHLATAMHTQCAEVLSIDGRLATRVKQTTIAAPRIVAPLQSRLLPEEYDPSGKPPDLFPNEDQG